MVMRLVLDMAAAAGAAELVPIQLAHLSGVSPLTGGLGLRRFLARLAEDPQAQVAVPTTLNSAGCDAGNFSAMRIPVPGFLEQSQEIVRLYTALGVEPTQSCIPYELDGVVTQGIAAWSESNAICFGNSYCDMITNRESGLSALACALTGYTPKYGLLIEAARRPNLEVLVEAELDDPTDFSILGDWIGWQRTPAWRMPYGPIPLIRGLPQEMDHEQRKALTAAAANYGVALVYVEGIREPDLEPAFQDTLRFTEETLVERYEALRPRLPVSLIVIGCPQASIGELRAVAGQLKNRHVTAQPEEDPGRSPLWIFTSKANKAIAEQIGLGDLIRESGALLLENTCPEVVPYDKSWVKHILTNSMKAEHYIKSGLNGIPTSVLPLAECVAVAAGELAYTTADDLTPPSQASGGIKGRQQISLERDGDPVDRESRDREEALFRGRGLPSQDDFTVRGEAFVSEAPITFLGYVNRESGVVEEEGHPANGRSMAGKIAIFPKGSGSTVAPYVILELHYRGMAPAAIVNTEIDQQSAPACSLEAIPYAYDFDPAIVRRIRDGDRVELIRKQDVVTLRVLKKDE